MKNETTVDDMILMVELLLYLEKTNNILYLDKGVDPQFRRAVHLLSERGRKYNIALLVTDGERVSLTFAGLKLALMLKEQASDYSVNISALRDIFSDDIF
ncbi:hypothetical protein ACLEX4_23080 [Pseudescherichia vulneris]